MKHAWLALALAACQNTKQESPPQQQPPQQPSQQENSSQMAPQPPSAPSPGSRTDLTNAFDRDGGKSTRIAVADLDGDGDREIVAIDAKMIRVLDATGRDVTSLPVVDGIQQLLAADLDGDKRAELYAGWGQTRDHMDSVAKITTYRFEKGKLVEEVIATPATSRQDVTSLTVYGPSELLVGYFDSKYMVTSMVATKGAKGWTTKTIASIRLAANYARGDLDGDGKPELVVGRVYGDEMGVQGDAFVLAADGTRKMIPSTRGLRSVITLDTDGDKRAEIFMGDGWHNNYAKEAHGLLTTVKLDGTLATGTFTSALIEDTGQYEVSKILPATIDGKLALVTQGNSFAKVFWRDNGAWKSLTYAGVTRDIAVGDLDGKPGDEIVIAADKSELIDLTGALR